MLQEEPLKTKVVELDEELTRNMKISKEFIDVHWRRIIK